REDELRRDGGGPGPERGRTRQAVEGTVELHGVEAGRIVREPRPHGQRARIEARPPVAVDVAAGADEPTSRCRLSSWGPRTGPQTPNVRSAPAKPCRSSTQPPNARRPGGPVRRLVFRRDYNAGAVAAPVSAADFYERRRVPVLDSFLAYVEVGVGAPI